jgi:hypothetical protein
LHRELRRAQRPQPHETHDPFHHTLTYQQLETTYYPARHDSGLPSTNKGGPRRPPKWQRHQQQPASGDSNNKKISPSRPTHFLALPIGHHPEFCNAISALTSSWLTHEPPIEGLDPSIVVHPCRLHLTLGVMVLTSSPNPNPNPSPSKGKSKSKSSNTIWQVPRHSSLAWPRAYAILLAQNPLRVPLDRLAIMQPDPARAHVLYAELRSTDGRRLRAVCGASAFAFFDGTPYFLPLPSGFFPWRGHAALI